KVQYCGGMTIRIFLKKLIDLLLYGNFWIAAGALAMSWQSQLIFTGQIQMDALAVFVFFSTLFLYAVHRIVGISKLHEYFQLERYSVIVTFKTHIQVYAFIGLLGTGVSFFYLAPNVQAALVIPGLLSLGYVIPFWGEKKRLRDLNHIKIFLVAIVWAWVSVLLPAIQEAQTFDLALALMMLERALFVFAITLPFDIRDLNVDMHSEVKTIPAQLGWIKARSIALVLIVLAGLLALELYYLEYYSFSHLLALSIAYLLTAFLIYRSHPDRHDYFYTGLMDGTMILQFVLFWFLHP
ncbi:MAG: hypothetical protein AAF985_20305, partial [Bacteroidota bacterium]